MTNSERASYIRGLMDGLQLDQDAKETKIFNAIVDLLDDICVTVEELEDGFSSVTEEIEELDENLSEVEELIYGECSCGHHHDDDEELHFEVECPSCKENIEIDEEMLTKDSMTCPKCGETLEFFFDDVEDEEEYDDDENEGNS